MTTSSFDLIVVGAGPAGLAAAGSAAAVGLKTLLLDEQVTPGGQIYRGLADADKTRLDVLGADYAAGRHLLSAVHEPTLSYRPGATVWEVSASREVFYSIDGRAHRAGAAQVVIATGALERPMPMPGWTLPGVMTAGAAQIALKANLVPDVEVILAGSGPLLYLLATQLERAGTHVSALVDTTPADNWWRAAPHLLSSLAAPEYLWKGRGLYRDLASTNIPHFRRAENLAVIAHNGRAAGLQFTVDGRLREIPAGLVLVHQGVVPNVQLTRSLRLQHDWDARARAWLPAISSAGVSATPGISVAGDGAAINGAVAAAFHGELVGLNAARAVGIQVAPAKLADAAAAYRRHCKPRALIDLLYQPASAYTSPADDVIVCRCEEVTAGALREYVRLGCPGPNQAKAFGRCGMGPCQGRYCGLTVSEVMAEARGVSPAEVGYYRLRAPVKPVTVGELASLDEQEVKPSSRVV